MFKDKKAREEIERLKEELSAVKAHAEYTRKIHIALRKLLGVTTYEYLSTYHITFPEPGTERSISIEPITTTSDGFVEILPRNFKKLTKKGKTK